MVALEGKKDAESSLLLQSLLLFAVAVEVNQYVS